MMDHIRLTDVSGAGNISAAESRERWQQVFKHLTVK